MDRSAKRDGAAVVLAALVILAYACLLPDGRWQGDEYFAASLLAGGKWSALLASLHWAPRPIGQPLGWLYLVVSNALNRPLATVFLLGLWIFAFAWICLAGWIGRERHPVSLACMIFALTLLLCKPGEMFYWPAGAAAYLPCWAGLAGVTILLRRPLPAGLAVMASLLLAVLCLEVGAVTALIFAGLTGVAAVFGRHWRRLWPLVVPAVCAGMVCVLVVSGRMQPMAETMDASSGLAGHWLASLGAAVPAFTRELFGIAGLPMLVAVPVKMLLLACVPARAAPRGPALLWAAALLGAAFSSEVLAYHQFGVQCCERHITQRHAMVVLALVSVAGLRPLFGGLAERVRPVALAVLLAGLLCLRGPALAADWRLMPAVLAARQENWDAGRMPGDAMTMRLAPQGQITNYDTLPLGSFSRAANAPWFALGILDLFHKDRVDIVLAK